MRAGERMVARRLMCFLAAASMWLGTAPAHAAAAPGAPSGGVMNVEYVGSGVLVSADGKVVTAAHVVQTADTVDVEFTDGTAVQARVAASDIAADVALLQIDRVPPHISPAERLGLRGGRYAITIENEPLLIGGDLIVAVEGIALAEPDAYERVRRRLLEVRAKGDLMHLSVMRDGELTELTAGFEP